MTEKKAAAETVQFGDDDWGKWATGVQGRLDAQEQRIAAVEAAVAAVSKDVEGVKKSGSGGAKGGKASGDADDRIAALERTLGIGATQAEHGEKVERRTGSTTLTVEGATLASDANPKLKQPFAVTAQHSVRKDKTDGSDAKDVDKANEPA